MKTTHPVPEDTALDRTVEYSVNVSDGVAFPWNPFDQNFAWPLDAEEAALQYLRDNAALQTADVYELVIEGEQIVDDKPWESFSRDSLSETPAAH